jgi:acetylornithine deacetylase/succinyl-diaminopimelate desuccinylase-like protein
VTLVPTVARASEKANVIPSHAEILVDCRVPPGMGEAEVRERAGAVLGLSAGDPAATFEMEFVEHVVGNRSPTRSPLADTIESWLAEADPGAALVPMAMAGFSDSHWFRKAFDSAIVYGFCPQRELSLPEAAPLVHGADERAAVADVELAAGFYRHMAQEVLG